MNAETKNTAQSIIDKFCGNAYMADFDDYLIDIQTKYYVHDDCATTDKKDEYSFLFHSLRKLFKDIRELKEINAADSTTHV